MRGKPSAWRMSDTAAYDVAVELANALIAGIVGQEGDDRAHAATHISALRAELHVVDPSDRAAVENLIASIEQRIEAMPR